MAAPKVKIKRSSVAGKVPSLDNIIEGELAINTTDKRLYARAGDDVFDVGTKRSTEVFKPSQYGATGDGSDETAAILLLVAAVAANGGGTVDLEDKIYTVSQTIAFGVPITLLCGKGAGFRAMNVDTFLQITDRSGAGCVDPVTGAAQRVLFDIKGMAYSNFQGKFTLTGSGGTQRMGGVVNYVQNVIAITQQDGTGGISALNGEFENLYVTKLAAAFYQPAKVTGYGPVLPYTRTWFCRLEIINCYQAWNFQHVNGFDDCAVGVLRINKCAVDAHASAFDLNVVEAFLAGGKAEASAAITTTASSDAFTTTAHDAVAVGDNIMIRNAETYGQGWVATVASVTNTTSGGSNIQTGTFTEQCPRSNATTLAGVNVSEANRKFIFAAGGFNMDRATFVCSKLYLEGAFRKLLYFSRQSTLNCETLKLSTGEFSCYKGRPIVFEQINSVCYIDSVPQSEHGVNGNPLVEVGLGKLIQSYVYYGLRKWTDLAIPADDPEADTFDFYPNHKCTVTVMMTEADMVGFGIKPIEVGHTIYDPAGFAGTGIRRHTTSDSQLVVNYSNKSVKVSGDIGGAEKDISVPTSVYNLNKSGTGAQNTAALTAAWNALRDKGGKILISAAGNWQFDNSEFGETSKPITIEAVDGVLIEPSNPLENTWMWYFKGDSSVTEVNFTNIWVSGQYGSDSRREFLGVKVGRSNNMTVTKCFGRFVDGTAWHFLRPHNSEIDVTTFNSGKDNSTHANRFAMMITGYYNDDDSNNIIRQVFNDVRLSGTSEKDYYGWVVEAGTVLRTTSQLKIHGSENSYRGLQIHRVADFTVQLNSSQKYKSNGFIHISDAAVDRPYSATVDGFVTGQVYTILDLGTSSDPQTVWRTYTGTGNTFAVGSTFTATSNSPSALTGAWATQTNYEGSGDKSATLFVGQPVPGTLGLGDTASKPMRGTVEFANVTNSQLLLTAPASVTDMIVIDAFAQFSSVKCIGQLVPQAYDTIAVANFVSGIQYVITSLGTDTPALQGDWNTYAGTSGVTYKVGSIFTATGLNTSALTTAGAQAHRLHYQLGLPHPGRSDARVYVGDLTSSRPDYSLFLNDKRTADGITLSQDILPAVGGATLTGIGTQTPKFEVTRLNAIRTSNPPAIFNRKGNRGDILQLESGGLRVGAIGVDGTTASTDRLYIESDYEGAAGQPSGTSGLTFETDAILPRNDGATTDTSTFATLFQGQTALGSSQSKFRDLYLSNNGYATKFITLNNGYFAVGQRGGQFDGSCRLRNDGTDSFLEEISDGDLKITCEDVIELGSGTGDKSLKVFGSSGFAAYYAGDEKMRVNAGGVLVAGGTDLNLGSNLKFSSEGYDSRIAHNSSVGYLDLRAQNGYIKMSSPTTNLATFGPLACELKHNNVTRISTTASGVQIVGDVSATGGIHTDSGTITGPATLTIDPAGVGDNTGTVVIAGNLQVDGVQTTINSTAVTLDDKNIVLSDGAANASAANGSGLTIDGADATMTYVSSGDKFEFNKPITSSGAITGSSISTTGSFSAGSVTATGIDVDGRLSIDTSISNTASTSQVAIHTAAHATLRSGRYTVQITNSTDNSYQSVEILLIHDGSNVFMTEFGSVFTGASAEATFDADISGTDLRLLATPASSDSLAFKVVRHSITQ